MTTILDFIIWSPAPEIFTIPGLDREVRWYGLLFAMSFIAGQQVMHWIFKTEGKDPKGVEQLTMYVVLATIIGARLGHCLFYDPAHYLSHPLDIIKVWEGGLASHGGALAIFLSLYLYSRKHADKSYLWVLDRVAIITVLAGSFIRMGNYMNSEIIGLPTGTDNGVVFARNIEDMLLSGDERIEEVSFEKGAPIAVDSAGFVPMTITLEYRRGIELVPATASYFFETSIPKTFKRYSHIRKHAALLPGDKIEYKLYKTNGVQYADMYLLGIPRHPGQLYEALACVLMFLILLHVWYHHRTQIKTGFLFGLFMTMLWAERFAVEFFKENQESWEADIPLNMGQWLSVPLFFVGLFILIKSWGFTKKVEA